MCHQNAKAAELAVCSKCCRLLSTKMCVNRASGMGFMPLSHMFEYHQVVVILSIRL